MSRNGEGWLISDLIRFFAAALPLRVSRFLGIEHQPSFTYSDCEIMPTIYRYEGFRFFFYSSDRAEPAHVHVERNNDTAKIWLSPVRLQLSHGFSRTEINMILKIVKENHTLMIRSWNEYFRREE